MNRLINSAIAVLVLVITGLVVRSLAEGDARDVARLKQTAYYLSERGQYEKSAAAFQEYIAARPTDGQTIYDYAMLLIRLERHGQAAEQLETARRLDPQNEPVYFQLGVEYARLGRNEQAASVFSELRQSANPDIARPAAAVALRLSSDLERAARLQVEQDVYDLAKNFKFEETIAAINELEKQGELSYGMALQRIYAYASLQRYAPALALADALLLQYPKATDLMLARAELLLQMGRQPEAVAQLERITKEKPGSEDARTAMTRLMNLNGLPALGSGAPPVGAGNALSAEEIIIYSLAEKRLHRQVIAAVDDLEKKQGRLAWNMQMQRVYALQGCGDVDRAMVEAEKLAAERPDSVELGLIRSDLLFKAHRWQEASAILKEIRTKNPNTPVAKEADRRLAEIPAVENLDKWNWGEAYMSGDYHGRFGSVIGYGYIRSGTYVPSARWLQPYVSFQFLADTKSGGGALQTIVADNSVGLYAGLRAQLFTTEYLFLYVQGGGNTDLLGRRNNGNWRGDYQAGIYGYKAWGPGVNWTRLSQTNKVDGGKATCCSLETMWRGDWWVDAGADFSYYDRFERWLGYGQVREGVRILQFGNRMAVDGYVMENIAWDIEGVYTDNLFEAGPGLRMVYTLWRNWQIVLRTEWAEGVYFGRNYNNTKGDTDSTYGDFRAGISMGVNW